jgi:hypothetical protein
MPVQLDQRSLRIVDGRPVQMTDAEVAAIGTRTSSVPAPAAPPSPVEAFIHREASVPQSDGLLSDFLTNPEAIRGRQRMQPGRNPFAPEIERVAERLLPACDGTPAPSAEAFRRDCAQLADQLERDRNATTGSVTGFGDHEPLRAVVTELRQLAVSSDAEYEAWRDAGADYPAGRNPAHSVLRDGIERQRAFAADWTRIRDSIADQNFANAEAARQRDAARAELQRQQELKWRAQGMDETVVQFNREFLPHPTRF